MTFESLGLSTSLLHAIKKVGYTNPSPIQEKAIPVILDRKDVLASAQTGTGKTAGFVLPILQILSEERQLRRKPIRSLILTPTRELAAQIQENVIAYSEFLHLDSAVIFGGVKQGAQVKALRNGVDILVATPGRLLDLHNQGLVSLAHIQVFVLDEADRMLDMGFLRDIRRIMSLIPDRRQNLLFSATFSKEIKQLAGSFMSDPELVEATPENTAVEVIVQKMYRLDRSRKAEFMTKLITEGNWQQVLVFSKTKHGANRLSKKLDKMGVTSAAIHGDKSQGARTNALAGFKKGSVRVLVATDIAARGLDIPLLPHVINFDLPKVAEDYVHRIGRTGRAGASGEAISLVSNDDLPLVRGIEKLIGEKIPTEIPEGYKLTDPASPDKVKKEPSHRKKKEGQQSKQDGSQSNHKKTQKSSGFKPRRKKKRF